MQIKKGVAYKKAVVYLQHPETFDRVSVDFDVKFTCTYESGDSSCPESLTYESEEWEDAVGALELILYYLKEGYEAEEGTEVEVNYDGAHLLMTLAVSDAWNETFVCDLE